VTETTEDPRQSNTYLVLHVGFLIVFRINAPHHRLAQDMTGVEILGETAQATILLMEFRIAAE